VPADPRSPLWLVKGACEVARCGLGAVVQGLTESDALALCVEPVKSAAWPRQQRDREACPRGLERLTEDFGFTPA
jgi:hypothetical protein